jgi:hypothetical protein
MQSTKPETNPETHPQTGPTSATGKSRSSDNATTHGGTSQKLIVAGEQQSDFTNLLSGLLSECAPETPSARLLVEDFAHAQWRIRKSKTPTATPSPATNSSTTKKIDVGTAFRLWCFWRGHSCLPRQPRLS